LHSPRLTSPGGGVRLARIPVRLATHCHTLLTLYFKDAQRGWFGLFEEGSLGQRTFGDPRPCLASRDQLAWELDQLGRQVYGSRHSRLGQWIDNPPKIGKKSRRRRSRPWRDHYAGRQWLRVFDPGPSGFRRVGESEAPAVDVRADNLGAPRLVRRVRRRVPPFAFGRQPCEAFSRIVGLARGKCGSLRSGSRSRGTGREKLAVAGRLGIALRHPGGY
jgi:hypothetical protein